MGFGVTFESVVLLSVMVAVLIVSHLIPSRLPSQLAKAGSILAATWQHGFKSVSENPCRPYGDSRICSPAPGTSVAAFTARRYAAGVWCCLHHPTHAMVVLTQSLSLEAALSNQSHAGVLKSLLLMISVFRTGSCVQCQERFFQARFSRSLQSPRYIARQQFAQDRLGFRGVNFKRLTVFFHFGDSRICRNVSIEAGDAANRRLPAVLAP